MKHFPHSRLAELIHVLQQLEPRTLLSSSVSHNSAVIMNTSLGEIAIELYNDGTEPATVANFLSYVNSGTYNGTIFHRVTYNGDSNSDTFGIVQGGGFTNASGTPTLIPTSAPIALEATPTHPNSIGTIAMARTSGLNSATSEFFFNTTDNSTVFDNNSADSGYNPYAVFGNVVRGFGIVETIDNLNTSNSVTSSDGETLNPPETSSGSFVSINSATEADTLTVTAGPNDAAGAKTVTFEDAGSHSKVTISLSKADATLTFTGTSLTATPHGSNVLVSGSNLQLQEINSTDATAKSSLAIKGKATNLGDIDISGSVNSISGSTATFSGDMNISGGVKTMKLAGTSAAGLISLDTAQIANAPATSISIPNLTDVSIESSAPINKLTAKSFKIDDGTNRGIAAAGIFSLNVSGDLEGNVDTDGAISAIKAGDSTAFIQASNFGKVTFGSMTGGYIYSSAALNAKAPGIASVSIKGVADSAQIVAAGSIGPITAASLTNSVIVAGYDNSGNGSAADNFQYPIVADSGATLESVKLKSAKGAAASFSGSQILASKIGALNLGRVFTTNSGNFSTIGIQAHALQSLSMETDQNQSVKLSNITDQSAVAAATANDSLGDFTIDII